MLRIKAPASSANIGPGFDCLGLALNVYNTYDVEPADSDILENVEDRYNNSDNLFLKAYRAGCESIGVNDHIRVRFDCQIPSTRGMGSSASFLAAGVAAAGALHDNSLSKEDIFQLITKMEGHPDNTGPCVFGGLCASLKTDSGLWLLRKRPVHESWKFTLLVPDFEVSTSQARKILPDSYSRKETVDSVANALMLAEALKDGDEELLRSACRDVIHEPYRAKLIHGYEDVRSIVKEDTGGSLVISGSGPALLLLSKKELSASAQKAVASLPGARWQIINAGCAEEGIILEEV